MMLDFCQDDWTGRGHQSYKFQLVRTEDCISAVPPNHRLRHGVNPRSPKSECKMQCECIPEKVLEESLWARDSPRCRGPILSHSHDGLGMRRPGCCLNYMECSLPKPEFWNTLRLIFDKLPYLPWATLYRGQAYFVCPKRGAEIPARFI
jgi:hypothetical protein